MRSLLWVAVAACGPSSIGVPLGNAAPEPPLPVILVPTLATAGADVCKLDDAVQLGRWGGSPILIAFDGTFGVAAWKRDDIDDAGHHLVALQLLAPDGTRLGPERAIVVDELEDVARVTARPGALEVVLASSDPQKRPSAVIVDGAGHVTERREPLPAPRLESSTAGLTVTITDDGAATPPDGSRFDFERPTLHRTVGGKPLGTPVALTYRDKPIRGVDAIFTDSFWSGARVLYPFWTNVEKPPYYIEARWFLLPIDCRP